MGYIPAPSRGVLKVQAAEPAPIADTAWWDTTNGRLSRFSDPDGAWKPVGERDGSTTSLRLGRAVDGPYAHNGIGIGIVTVNGNGSVAIGNGVDVGTDSVVIGEGAYAPGAGVVVGRSARAINVDPDTGVDGDPSADAIVIGARATADVHSIVIGTDAYSSSDRFDPSGGYNVVMAGRAENAAGSVAIGGEVLGVSGSNLNGVAIGGTVRHARGVAIGGGYATMADGEVVFGGANRIRLTDYSTENAIIMYSADGSPWQLTVSNAGALVVAPFVIL